MIVAGLDVSKTATGWAVFDGANWSSGVWKCPVKPPPEMSAHLDAQYAGDVADWLTQQLFAWISANTPEMVGIEQPMLSNKGNTSFAVTHFLHGLALTAARCCASRNCHPEYVASQTWRSTFGMGLPPKHGVIKDKVVKLSPAQRRAWYKDRAKEICERRSIVVASPDQAEAVCIALHFLEMQKSAGNLFAGAA